MNWQLLGIQLAERTCRNISNVFARATVHLQGLEIKYSEDPSLEQWSNRLVEYIDTRSLVLAYQHFADLIARGIDPEHAFHIVVGSAV